MIHSIINRGVRDYHDAEEQRQINLLNMSSAISFVFTTFFLTTNILQQHWLPVISNCLLLTFNISIFFINKLKYHTTTLYILIVALNIYFFTNAVLLHNSLQYGIFLTMVFTILIINKKVSRLLLLGFQIGLFIVYLLLQNRPALIPPIPTYKTCIASLGFLLAFAFMLEYFKERLQQYHKRLTVANQQLQESNRVKQRMLSILSHDFYGPVGNLVTSIDLLNEQVLTPEEFHDTGVKLKRQLHVLSTSMKDVLQWSKMQMQGAADNKSEVDICHTIDEISLLMETPLREKGLNLHNSLETGITAYANSDDVRLIFRNLFSNAIKFSNNSGSIFINAEKNTGIVRISIKDEGTGMPAEVVDALRGGDTSKFFSTPGTAKEKGTGLGLMLVREFIQKNNGELSIASEQGKGSIFSVSLPCKEAKS